MLSVALVKPSNTSVCAFANCETLTVLIISETLAGSITFSETAVLVLDPEKTSVPSSV